MLLIEAVKLNDSGWGVISYTISGLSDVIKVSGGSEGSLHLSIKNINIFNGSFIGFI